MKNPILHLSARHPELGACLFNQTAHAVSLFAVDDDATFRFAFTNEQGRHLDKRLEDMEGRAIEDIFPGGEAAAAIRCFQKAMQTKEAVFCKSFIHAAGEATVTPLFNKEKKCTHVMVVLRSLANQLNAGESPNLFESFFKHSADPIALWSIKGQALEINPAFEKVFGWTKNEFLDKAPVQTQDFIPDDEKTKTTGVFKEMLAGKTIPEYRAKRKCKRGDVLDVAITYVPIKNQNGTVTAAATSYRDLSKNKKLQKKLREAEEKFDLVWENTSDAICMFTLTGRLLHINPAFTVLFGWTKEDTEGAVPNIRFINAHLQEELQEVRDRLRNGQSVIGLETRRRKKDGSELDVLATYNPIQNEAGEYWASVGVYKDITKQKQVQAALMESEERYRLIAQHSHDMIKVLDQNGLILYASPSHKKILGFEPEELAGKTFVDLVHSDEKKQVKKKFAEAAEAGGIYKAQFRQRSKEGTCIWIEAIGTPMLQKGGAALHYTLVARDITERKRYEEKLRKYASLDSLTGLYNRRVFMETVDEAVQTAEQARLSFAIMYLDIDKFKLINDSYGHETGDELLKQFAGRLRSVAGPGMTLARLGGDEFTCLLPNTGNKQEAVHWVEEIQQVLRAPYTIYQQTFTSTSSIGIAMYPQDGQNTSCLLRHADEALYKAKQYRDSYQFYE